MNNEVSAPAVSARIGRQSHDAVNLLRDGVRAHTHVFKARAAGHQSEVIDRSGFLEHLRHARDFHFLQQPTDLLRRCLMLG